MLIFFSALSCLIIIFSIYRKNGLGLVDFFVIFSWFYIFFRPIVLEGCTDFINVDLYYWDSTDYWYGVNVSAFLLLMLQSGALLHGCTTIKFEASVEIDRICRINKISSFFIVFLLLLVFSFYGAAVLPAYRDAGALSVSLPGFNFIYPFLKYFSYLSISTAIFLYFYLKQARYLFQAFLLVAVLMVLGRRGLLVAPFISAFFIYCFVKKVAGSGALREFFQPRYFLIFCVLLVIVFGGKSIYSSGSSLKPVDTMPFTCLAVVKGYQEFDLFWPAIISVFRENSNLLDLPGAVIGNFVPHHERLDYYPEFYSITDKAMMKYNGQSYYYLKFGISPNIFQFHFSYFYLFSVVTVFATGFILSLVERSTAKAFLMGRPALFYLSYLTFYYLVSAMDFTLKYYVFDIFVGILGAVLIFIVSFFLPKNERGE